MKVEANALELRGPHKGLRGPHGLSGTEAKYHREVPFAWAGARGALGCWDGEELWGPVGSAAVLPGGAHRDSTARR
ncbi:hypothetical protein NDU88_006389 [Pleurodeles waltl]|uniref:Uncharacterized protein n=1 Tax=Pleurodeles waltl TaxID=8319 RepID=A0AAV7X0L9_PLEWA|nr:hypothetical protein NDU88_006389 [Pleurodeles waltl]